MGDSKLNAFKIIFPCFLLILGCLSGFGYWFSTLDYKHSKETYESLGKFVELVTTQEEGVLKTEDSTIYQIDWKSLKSINPDIVAWIKIPGTVIDYPVVQAPDNSTYLKKSFDGTDNLCGTIFMDSRNLSDFSDYNTIIYGHNMKDKSMFAVLNDYVSNEQLYKEADEIWILTENWQRKYHVISAHLTEDMSESYTYQFAEGIYERHVSRELAASVHQGSTYDARLPMITLSTCHGSGSDTRAVVIAQPVYEVITSDTLGETE